MLENFTLKTQTKLLIARVIYRLLKLLKKKEIYEVERNGIRFQLDIKEGIDLHIFLLGRFQKHVYRNKLIEIKEKTDVLDIGANNGAMSLFFAKEFSTCNIHSFEPTTYAYKKFQKNLELNPKLANRIFPNLAFVSNSEVKIENPQTYSSWPLNSDVDKHQTHGGVLKNNSEASTISVDKYCQENKLNVSFIKIDTDGYEFDVLRSATNTLKQMRPIVIFEAGLYIFEERKINFKDIIEFFNIHNYEILTTKGKRVDIYNYNKIIPKFSTIDILAIYKKNEINL